VATLNLEDIRLYRNTMNSRPSQASTLKTKLEYVPANIALSGDIQDLSEVSKPITADFIPDPMFEIASAPALWLWDYLRRSGARGFFLPLSGGADSTSVAAIVASMCRILFNSI